MDMHGLCGFQEASRVLLSPLEALQGPKLQILVPTDFGICGGLRTAPSWMPRPHLYIKIETSCGSYYLAKVRILHISFTRCIFKLFAQFN